LNADYILIMTNDEMCCKELDRIEMNKKHRKNSRGKNPRGYSPRWKLANSIGRHIRNKFDPVEFSAGSSMVKSYKVPQ